MPTQTTKGLICSGGKASFLVAGIQLDGFHNLYHLLCLFDKATLDTDTTVSEVLATTVSNVLFPIAIASLVMESSQNGGPFFGCVDPNAPVLVVDL